MLEETVTVSMPDGGQCPVHVFAPGDGGKHPGVIMYVDAIGIRPPALAIARRLAGHGYVVCMPDVFYRAGAYAPLDPQTVFSSPDPMGALGPLISTTSAPQAAADTAAWLEYLRSRKDVAEGGIGVTGYCMGGTFAYRAAGTHPDDIAALITFHAGNLVTDDETSPAAVTANITARVVIAGADHDPIYPPEQAAELDRLLTEAGVDHVMEIYPDALHGWTQTDFPVYDEAAAERGFAALVSLFDTTLKAA